MSWVGTYILDENGKPKKASTLEWGEWFASHERHVRDDYVDGVRVSTVFLGLDHDHLAIVLKEPHDPILWETMIFGGEHDQYTQRYTSAEDALAGHMEALGMLEGWNKDMRELERIFSAPDWAKI